MSYDESAQGRFKTLEAERQSFYDRCKAYATLTIPRLCLDRSYQQDNNELAHDYQSVGSQCVNVLSNKIMLALFAPSRPFFRYQLDSDTREKLKAAGVPDDKILEMFAGKEQEAIDLLDQMNCRPALFELVQLLIVTGNALLILPKDKTSAPRVYGLENYVVKRNCDGEVIEVLIKRHVVFSGLQEDLQAWLKEQQKGKSYEDDSKLCLYEWYCYEDGKWELETWVDDIEVELDAYQGKYDKDECPAKPQVWTLSSGADYGTGIVEDYARDFAAISELAEALVQGGIMVSEFRWTCDPEGQTRPEDLTATKNGAVVPGKKDDINIVTSGQKGTDLQIVQAMMQDYIKRVYTGFLVLTGAVRDSERTTAEEVRMTAQELEQQLGGGYTRIATGLQVPMAHWLSDKLDLSLKGTKVKVKIVTGLNAMSRSGDADKMTAALAQLAQMSTWPPELLAKLKVDAIAATIFAGQGLMASQYVKSQAEVAQEQAQAQQALIQQRAGENLTDAATIPQEGTNG